VWAARRAAAGDGLRQPGVGQGARPGTRKAAVGRLCGGGAVARSGDGGALGSGRRSGRQQQSTAARRGGSRRGGGILLVCGAAAVERGWAAVERG